jgi:hypothetical protein
MLIKSYYHPEELFLWDFNGGSTTLKSFSVSKPSELPRSYVSFLESLPLHDETADAVFVHAGLNLHTQDPFSSRDALLWAYDWYDDLIQEWPEDKKIIPGDVIHTSYEIEKILEELDNFPVMCIDNGCYMDAPGYHQLCAFDLTNRKLHFEKNRG